MQVGAEEAMGKNQHSKDRLFLTRTEWNNEWGGHKKKNLARFRRLPFYCCGISLQPFEDPVCTKTDGTCFDITALVPYIRKYKCHPVSGLGVQLGDLVKLNFKRGPNGEYLCPITAKVFNEHTHIVAIATTGNVYSYEAVSELNLKAKNWHDLLDESQTFTRKDVIHIQNPKDLASREIERFHSTKEKHSVDGLQKPGADIRVVSEDSRRILSHLSSSTQKAQKKSKENRVKGDASGPKSSALAETATHLRSVPKKAGTATWDTSKTTAGSDPSAAAGSASSGPVLTEKGRSSTGAVSRSFTSTSVAVHTENTLEVVRRDLKPAKGKKGYVRLVTTLGDLNLELHCDMCPRTCENFLTHCQQGYYDKTVFHRSIRKFMIQGGDPTGTGRGGESIYGGPFKDELDSRLLHSGRGILAMANRGKNTNTSQFYLLYCQAPHLNYKHTVFGKVVGGLQTLDAMEAVETDGADRPLQEIRVTSAVVFANPFEEILRKEKEEERERREERERERKGVVKEGDQVGQWYSNPGGHQGSKQGGGVGKYLNLKRPANPATSPPTQAQQQRKKPKKASKPASYGNFDSW